MALFSDLAQQPLLLVGAVFAASMLQAVTGIGFGVIAGPILLAVIGSTDAIQVSIVLSLLIAVILAPNTVPKVSRDLLKPIFLGLCIGTPIGGFSSSSCASKH
ncbi:MAG: TSUP family transporter [Pseudomonadota bacterium]